MRGDQECCTWPSAAVPLAAVASPKVAPRLVVKKAPQNEIVLFLDHTQADLDVLRFTDTTFSSAPRRDRPAAQRGQLAEGSDDGERHLGIRYF